MKVQQKLLSRINQFQQKEEVPFLQQNEFEFKEETIKVLIWSIASFGAETLTLRELDQKYMENFAMWCCRMV